MTLHRFSLPKVERDELEASPEGVQMLRRALEEATRKAMSNQLEATKAKGEAERSKIATLEAQQQVGLPLAVLALGILFFTRPLAAALKVRVLQRDLEQSRSQPVRQQPQQPQYQLPPPQYGGGIVPDLRPLVQVRQRLCSFCRVAQKQLTVSAPAFNRL